MRALTLRCRGCSSYRRRAPELECSECLLSLSAEGSKGSIATLNYRRLREQAPELCGKTAPYSKVRGYMRHSLIATLFLAMNLPSVATATAQIPDEIVLDEESSPLHAEPLNQLIWRRPEEGGIKLDRPLARCTASYRGYRASWRIHDDQLFLDKIFVDPCAKEPKEVSVEALFPGKPMPIKADWHTGVLIVPRGKLVQYVHMGYQSTYERYVVLVLKKGRVVSRVELDEPPR